MIATIGAIYIETKELVLDPDVLFSLKIYEFLFDKNKKAIYLLIILEQIIFIGVLLWQAHRLKNRANCSVQYVHIEDIASIWLKSQRIKENIAKDIIDNSRKEFEKKENRSTVYVNFKNPKGNEIFSHIIMPHIDRLLEDEISIIIDLLRLLEDKGDIPSVVSYTEKDPEVKYKRDILTEDGLTSYEILRKVSLYDHTLNVVRIIYEELKRHSRTNYVLLLGKAIIVALAHDIGKIKKMEERFENISPEIFSVQPHHHLSKIFFQKMYPEYKDRKIVIEAIDNHHAIKIQGGNDLIKLLVAADKGAREFEIDEYLKASKAQEDHALAERGEGALVDEENVALKKALENALLEKQLAEDKASKCHLTKAYTRAVYDQDIKKYFDENREKLALAFVDADKFKTINDTYGHHAGDEVLKNMVEIMIETTKPNGGRVYRYGGEEFLILFPEADEKELELQLEALREKIENSLLNIDGKDIRYTISIGVGLAKDYESHEELTKKSDEAVYQAKSEGRNRVVFAKAKQPNESRPIENQEADFNVTEDFKTMMKKSHKAKSKPSRSSVKSKEKQEKSNKDYSDLNTEESFLIEEYENRILEELKYKINFVKNLGYETIFCSISYKDMILFSFSTIVEAIENAISHEVDGRQLAIYFIREYRKSGNIGYINTDENYVTSKFYIEDNGNLIEHHAVPLFSRIFDMNEHDLLQLKLANDYTKNAKVLTYNEVNP